MKTAKTIVYGVFVAAVAVFAIKTFLFGGDQVTDPTDSPLYESLLSTSINTNFMKSEFVLGETPVQQPQPHRPQPPAAGGAVNQHFKLGFDQYQKKEYATAAQYFEAAHRQAPNDPGILQYLAAAYSMLGQKEKATEANRKAEQLRKGHQPQPTPQPRPQPQTQPQPQLHPRPQKQPPVELQAPGDYLAAATELYIKGRFKEAIPFFDAAIKADPKNPDPYYSLGNCYLITGDTDKMVQYYEAAVGVAPESTTAHYYLGVAYTQVEKSDLARKAFQKTVELDPQHTHAHEGLGKLLKAEGKHDEAMKEFQHEIDACKELIRKKPEDPSSYNRLAQFYLRNDVNLKEGIEVVTKALEIDPESAPCLATAAQLHFKTGNKDKAIELVDKAIAKKTDRTPYYEMIKKNILAPADKP